MRYPILPDNCRWSSRMKLGSLGVAAFEMSDVGSWEFSITVMIKLL